jgi:hypothetical protein
MLLEDYIRLRRTQALRMGSRWTSIDKWFIEMTCGPRCPSPSTALTEQWVRPLRQLSGEHALHGLMVKSDYGLTPQQIGGAGAAGSSFSLSR